MNENVLDRFEAEDDWRRARRKLLYEEVVCLIKKCSVDLLSFEEVRKKLRLRQRLYRGLQEIPLDQIRGSVGRFDDFSAAFLPRSKQLRQRWMRVDVAMQEGKTPPIEVYQIGQNYFVLDGNHRVSVARQRGLGTIESYVWEFVGPSAHAAEADIDRALIGAEQAAFLDSVGEANADRARTIVLTCPGCYDDLANQIEVYRQGVQEARQGPYSFDQAFSDWFDETYAPTVEAIRQNGLVFQFPDRTEADLFVWARQNGLALEELEGESQSSAG
jgi:hypothetical protein